MRYNNNMIRQLFILAMVMLAASVATVAAEDAPAMWMEQNEDTIALMVNTSAEASGVNAWVHFAPAVINITDIDLSMSPWQPMTGTGWSHQGDHVVIAVTDFNGVAAGEYQVATMDVTCLAAGSSLVTITHAEPGGIAVSNLAYVCADAPPVDADATISIGDGEGDVTLPILISDAGNAGAVDITLTYDPAVVSVTGVTAGGMDCTYINDENSGAVRIGATQGSNPGLDNFTLVNVTLAPIGRGSSCALEISVTTLKDATPDGAVINYTISSGTYSEPPSPDPFVNGDVNDDGVCDIADGAYLANYLIGVIGYETINVVEAEVNDDGIVDMADSMYLTKHVMGDPDFATLR